MQIAISHDDGTYILWADDKLEGKVIETNPEKINSIKKEFAKIIKSLQELHLNRQQKEEFLKSIKVDSNG